MATARLRGGKGAGGQRPGQGCASHEAWCTEEGLAFTPGAGYPHSGAMEGDAGGDGRRGDFTAAGQALPHGLTFQPSYEGSGLL